MKRVLSVIFALMLVATALTGCGQKESIETNVDINEIHNTVIEELGEDYIPNMDMEMQEVVDLTGIDPDTVEEFIGQRPMISMNVDTFIAIKASQGKGDAAAQALESYRTYLVEESMQYPMNLPKVNASKVVQHGDYVFFLMLGGMNDQIDDVESEEAREFAEAETNRVEEVINSFF
ncbi:MAG: DUF4358 domain-containing protein [Gudongella sp.]|nr:DUF4358 domain-containing protein [Gudongella sp.]